VCTVDVQHVAVLVSDATVVVGCLLQAGSKRKAAPAGKAGGKKKQKKAAEADKGAAAGDEEEEAEPESEKESEEEPSSEEEEEVRRAAACRWRLHRVARARLARKLGAVQAWHVCLDAGLVDSQAALAC
jgi:hypothetical protein